MRRSLTPLPNAPLQILERGCGRRCQGARATERGVRGSGSGSELLRHGAAMERWRGLFLPETLGRETRALGAGAEFGPLDARVGYALQAAVRARDDVLFADNLRVAHEALRHGLRVLDELTRGVAEDARHDDLAVGQRMVFEHYPFP